MEDPEAGVYDGEVFTNVRDGPRKISESFWAPNHDTARRLMYAAYPPGEYYDPDQERITFVYWGHWVERNDFPLEFEDGECPCCYHDNSLHQEPCGLFHTIDSAIPGARLELQVQCVKLGVPPA